MRDAFTIVFAVAGTLLILVAIVGVVRLPDLLCRAHALTKAMTLGISLLLMSVWSHHGTESAGLKVVLAIFFLFVTIPCGGHLVGYVAYVRNLPRWKQREPDHLPATDGKEKS